ncbi:MULTISPECIES: carbamoyltransferase C-terminal domain-containing protein [unclassified Rhodococcus (in: high G+C Gram-positive bacteria)]|uniref:carbamoyltransferase family protein n=2 Tax=Rhodococcus TaxID=1827 RepID=UPI0015C67816|nr:MULTISPECIES: carbamoyltransferase C-terminal domain-containing protein [unclassified Rhodococcus (in: high G+C Gram-positive bacteria)]
MGSNFGADEEHMAVLGISGLFGTESDDYDPSTFFAFYHDAAACLVDGGETLAAIEEERLNRDKHTNRFPLLSSRACIDLSQLQVSDITHIAYFFEEEYTDRDVARIAIDDPLMPLTPSRTLLHDRLGEAFDEDVSDRPTIFVSHHHTHAASAFYDSGMAESLIVISDGNAERDGTSIFFGDKSGLRLLRTYDRSDSLGHFYTTITKMIGYRNFDEYKVMGLASFGNPRIYREMLERTYCLSSDGGYRLQNENLVANLFEAGFSPRRSSEKLTKQHQDLAAAAQEVLERIALHIIRYWLRETGSQNLCMAGGVAQNTTLNGKLLKLSELRQIYIPPSAHDAGAALGAAILVDQANGGNPANRSYSRTSYLGPDLGSEEKIADRLEEWSDFITYERPEDLNNVVATALNGGSIIGWAQGRGEFGPRALGNRSILADPRPADNRDRVNLMIKQREDYRPFAPVVTAEAAERYFELSGVSADHSHMSFVVPVRPEFRDQLGAITHVDGTARVQVVKREQNQNLWSLLHAFESIAGVPILLNTSFNNNAEPIVQTIDDVISTFVTTGLDLVVVGPYIVRRPNADRKALTSAKVELMPFVRIAKEIDNTGVRSEIFRTAAPNRRFFVSESLAALLNDCDQNATIPALLVDELWDLWDRRLIRVTPKKS